MVEMRKVVAIGLSRKNFSHRIDVTRFVISQSAIPLYPGITRDWYNIETKKAELKDSIEDFIKRADEFWVFGMLSEELQANVKLAKRLGKPVRYFELEPKLREIDENEIRFEEGFSRK